MNGTTVQVLAKLVNQDGNVAERDRYLEPALLAIRTMPKESTGHTASRLLYGFDLRTPAIWPSPQRDFVEGEYNEALLGRVQVIDGLMRDFWEQARARDEVERNLRSLWP
jgi:hypothetical protein